MSLKRKIGLSVEILFLQVELKRTVKTINEPHFRQVIFQILATQVLNKSLSYLECYSELLFLVLCASLHKVHPAIPLELGGGRF